MNVQVIGVSFLAQGLHLKSHQRCSAGIRTWLSADQSSSSTLTESSFLFDNCVYIYIYMKSSFPKRDKRQIKKKTSSSCHFAVYWTYSLLYQCFMPNRYISLFKMYLTLLTSQRGALATDAKSCSLWRSLLERPPPAPETRVRDPLGVMVQTRGGLTIIV